MNKLTINLGNDISELNIMMAKLEHFFEHNNISRIIMPMSLILEELYTNTISYGGVDGRKVNVEVNFTVDNQELNIIYKDNGVPFNPLKVAEPDLNVAIDDRAIGGLGVHYLRVLSDSVTYDFMNEKNVLRITKRF